MKRITRLFGCVALLVLVASQAQAQSVWSNGNSTSLWSDAANWSAGVPSTGSTAQFDDTGLLSGTPLTLGSASVGTLNFLNNSNSYTLGSSPSDTLSFGGGGNSLNQSGSATNTIAAGINASGLTGTISGGTLNLTGANSIDSTSAFNVSNNATVNVITSALGSAAVNLNGGNVVLNGGSTTYNGLSGNFWALSPGQTAASEGNGNQNNNWGNVTNDAAGAAVVNNVISNFGSPVIANSILPNNIAQTSPGTGGSPGAIYAAPSYGTPNNPFGGAAAPAVGYVGGLDFPNSGNNQNSFAAIGVNISGQGGSTTGAPNYTPTSGPYYNSISAEWTGTMTLANAGTLNVNLDSDDFSAIIIDGKVVEFRGNGGTGMSSSYGGSGNEASISLAAGAHTIQVAYDEGGGGWGLVGMYSFTPNGGSAGPATYIGNNDTTPADGITFTSAVLSGVNNSNPITSSGVSTVTVNSNSPSSVGTLTLNDGTNLTLNGTAPSLTFAGTSLTGTTATINNSMTVYPGAVTGNGSFTTLTAAGSGNLFLDNTGNTAFTSGTTINATGSGTVVGVVVGGVNTLGAATLNVNGGNFSLGVDNQVQTFANPITVNGSGGTITGQALGNGAITGQTITLTGGIALNSNLTLNTSNYNFTVSNNPIVGGGTLTYGSGGNTLSLNVANPGFTGVYNANTGGTNLNTPGTLTNATTYINNGATVNEYQSETLGNTNVNNGNLNVWANGVNLQNVNVNGSGNLQLVSNLGTTGGVGPANSIAGNVNLFSSQGAGLTLNMGNGSTIQNANSSSYVYSGTLNLTSSGGNTNIGGSGNGNSLTLNGPITGPGGLTQNSNATTTLSGSAGSASYAGATNVSSGTLALQTNLTGGGAVNVNGSGSTLNVGAGGSLGTSALNITSGLATITAPVVVTSGPGTISNGGTLSFDHTSGTASYTGSTINLNNGTIQVTQPGAIANLGGTNLVAVPFQTTALSNAVQGFEYNQGTATFNNNDPSNGSNPDVTFNHYLNGDQSAPNGYGLLDAAHNFGQGTIAGSSGINQPNGGADSAFYGFFTGNPSSSLSYDYNFTAAFIGQFTAPVAGVYQFGVKQNDDQAGVIVDTNGNGHFNPGDAFSGIGCCGNDTHVTETLAAGQTVLVGYADRDTGGGSGLVGYVVYPNGVNGITGGQETVADPTVSSQAGFWSTLPINNGGGYANVDAGATLQANSITGFTTVGLADGSTFQLSNQASPLSSDTVALNATGTSNSLILGTNSTLNVQNFSIGSGDNLTVSGGGTLQAVNGANSGTLTVNSGLANFSAGLSGNNTSSNIVIQSGGSSFGGAANAAGGEVDRAIASGATYAGYGSQDSGAGTNNTHADISAGTANLGAGSVDMSWRNIAAGETVGSTTNPPFNAGGNPASFGLISDVLNLHGMATTGGPGTATDPFELTMTYNPALIPAPLQSYAVDSNLLRLDWLNPTTGLWAHATTGDTGVGPNVETGFQGTFAQFESTYGVTSANLANFLGSWGTGGGTAWAIVDHNSSFAVAVPEPSSLVLFGLGMAGLIAVRRRRNRQNA